MTEIGRNTQRVVRENRVAAVPQAIWAPLVTGFLILVPGLVGLVTGHPLLFPSLAPTAALQATQPEEPSARFYNTVVGHLIGIVAAVACVLLLGAAHEPTLFASHHVFLRRVLASALAVALTQAGQVRVKALHPPAAATVLLITLGGFQPALPDLMILVVGVLVMAGSGERMRQLRLLQPGQK